MKQYVRYPRGWLPTAAVSQELVCIFHHYCLISCLCAWRPILHLTFLKVRQAAHVQQTRGNEVRGKVFTLVSVCACVCTYSMRACVAPYFSFQECTASLMGILSLVWHSARQLLYVKHEVALQRHILRKYQHASAEDMNPFFCTSFNLEEQLEAWYTVIEHVPGETLGNDDIFKRCIDAGRG